MNKKGLRYVFNNVGVVLQEMRSYHRENLKGFSTFSLDSLSNTNSSFQHKLSTSCTCW